MSTLDPGTLFAHRFEIQAKAGTGGMGTVYRARDRFSGELVALKLVQAASGISSESERFVRESQILSELIHPGIVSHIGHGQTPDGQLYLAMQWLEGEDLAQRLLTGALSIRDTLCLLSQVADALTFAHGKGIVHRDLKPSNLFLRERSIEKVILLDFGIARRTLAANGLTRSGMVLGTPGFMAPEQIRGSSQICAATDVFALGCVAYLCLTGHLPFAAEEPAAVLIKVLLEPPAPLTSLNPSIPRGLAELVHRMLAKESAERPVDGAAVRDALAVIAGQGISTDRMVKLPPSKAVSDREQFLYSIILADPTRPIRHGEAAAPQPLSSQDSDLHPTAALHAPAQGWDEYQGLLRALRSLGATPSFLPNGWLFVSLLAPSSATDQVEQAAQAALIVREQWPLAKVAMCTGRGVAEGLTPRGDVVERATKLMLSEQNLAPALASGILLDPLSAGLLAARFSVAMSGELSVLLKESREVDASRPLLGKPTPCVGRETELGTMEALLAGCVEEGESGALVVTAPPGAGKSRLRHEFVRRLMGRPEAPTLLIGRGERMSAGIPYAILSQAIRRLCAITGSEALETQQQLLRERIGSSLPRAEVERVATFLGELAEIPFPEADNPKLQLARQNPKAMQEQVRRAFQDFVLAECSVRPLLFVLDDFQWADELTVSLLDATLRELSSTPWCIVALARPEVRELFPRMWQGHRVQEIVLRGLGHKACERLIRKTLGEGVTDAEVARIIEQAGGNALFLEELIRAMAEGKSADQTATVLAMLQGRIGRFESVPRRVLRAASIFGQTFWSHGVAEVLGLGSPSPGLDEALDALVAAEVIERLSESRIAGEKEYGFRHGLIREAAYALLTEEDRTTGHRLAGLYLERVLPGAFAAIAEHLREGGELLAAVPHYLNAADAAMHHLDFATAIRMIQLGLECDAEPEVQGRFHALHAWIVFWQEGYAATAPIATRAMALLPAGSPLWIRSSWLSCVGHAMLRDAATTTEQIGLFLRTEPQPDAEVAYVEAATGILFPIVQSRMRSSASLLYGRIQQRLTPELLAVPNLRGAVCIAESEFWRHTVADPWGQLLGYETGYAVFQQVNSGAMPFGFAALIGLGTAHLELGDFENAVRLLRSCLEQVSEIDSAFLVSSAALHLAAALIQRDEAEGQREAEGLIKPIYESPASNAGYRGWAGHLLAQIWTVRGELEAAEAAARQAVALSLHAPCRRLNMAATLIDILLGQARVAEASSEADGVFAELESLGSCGYAELPARLAIAQAWAAAGRRQDAEPLLKVALDELERRTACIPDPALRERYRSQVSENRRLLRLGQQWR